MAHSTVKVESKTPTVGIIGDSHIVRVGAEFAALSAELNVEFVLKAQGGRGINRLPCSLEGLHFDIALVMLGGNDLASNANHTSAEELAEKLVYKLQGIADVVVFCSVWGRHDVRLYHRNSFNRRIKQLVDGSQRLLYHRMRRDLNSFISYDGVHLNQEGEERLIKCLRQVTRRARRALRQL